MRLLQEEQVIIFYEMRGMLLSEQDKKIMHMQVILLSERDFLI
jgi:hypothetical protein